MAWQIEFTETSLKQLKKIDKTIAKRLISFIKDRIATQDDPRVLGKALLVHSVVFLIIILSVILLRLQKKIAAALLALA